MTDKTTFQVAKPGSDDYVRLRVRMDGAIKKRRALDAARDQLEKAAYGLSDKDENLAVMVMEVVRNIETHIAIAESVLAETRAGLGMPSGPWGDDDELFEDEDEEEEEVPRPRKKNYRSDE